MSASAATITTGASGDTFITVHSDLGGPNSIHGSDSYLYSVSDGASPGYDAEPMLWFNLSAYAGQTVSGNGTVTLVDQTAATGSFPFAVYLVLVPWSEATTSWNSFGGVNPGVNISAAPLSTVTLNGGVGNLLSITVSQSLLQSWINSPNTNYGLLLHGITGWTSSSGFSDRAFVSSNSRTNAPSLTFSTVDIPEPASFWLVPAGLASVLRFRRRA